MPCDPNTLLNDARCFACLTEDQRAIIILHLLCQIAAGTTPPPPVFSPADIEGLTAWFNAEGLLISLPDNAPVNAWADDADVSNLFQGTLAKRPLFKTAIQNGLPVVRFDGVDDVMHTSAWPAPLAQPFTCYWVFRFRSLSGALQIFGNGITGPSDFAVLYANTGGFKIFAGGEGTLVAADTSWHILRVRFYGVTTSYRIDGAAEATPLSPGTSGPDGLTVGADFDDTDPAPVDVGEILYYSGILPSTDDNDLFGYLNGRWAIY